ncbi:LysR family transcriptional regulator [Agitococcus lubricus]|uniref:HTH-type transcriptional regulator MetR n=1 Tax=Agitococcus lubricus TaxID=1077255 RepID=A0A2T5J1A2_9GAMM|nr:LysR family transcriptional regulator [Agitococcus lubricus]PTQ90143.1 LysR family transcriptional regulator [Agitococcus lubricus]
MFDLRQLKTLVAIRDTGSLAEAAQRLHLTQSALSHQLKDLEHVLDLTLLVRKTRPPRFSKAGEALLALADHVLPLVRQTERELNKLRHGQAGRLMLAIECHSCFEWLMPTLNQFRDDWPEVELDFQTGFIDDAQESLLQREIDLVISSNPTQHPDLRFIPLFDYESVLVVGKQHRFQQRPFIYAHELADETLITYPIPHSRLDIFQHFLSPAGIQPSRLRSSELTLMMVQLAASERGVCSLPNWVAAEYVARDWVKTVSLGEHGVWCTLYAAIRQEDTELAFIEDFLTSARQNCLAQLAGIR